jgi:hypothetical protein
MAYSVTINILIFTTLKRVHSPTTYTSICGEVFGLHAVKVALTIPRHDLESYLRSFGILSSVE